MPTPQKRRMKRVYKRVSKGTKLVFKKKKSKNPRCGVCKKTLHGLTNKKGKVNRMFGGNTCSSCSKRKITNRVRALKLEPGNKKSKSKEVKENK